MFSGAFEVVVFLPGQTTGTELYSKLQKGSFPDYQQLAEIIAAYLESNTGKDTGSLLPTSCMTTLVPTYHAQKIAYQCSDLFIQLYLLHRERLLSGAAK